MQEPGAIQHYLESQMPAALQMLREMVAINSFTENRQGVNQLARLTATSFAPLGFRPQFVPATNPRYGDHLVLTRPGRSARNIAMVSHLDTVFPPEEEAANGFRWMHEGDRIYGPGTNDIKGGTVMMWLVLSALRNKAPQVFDELTWNLLWDAAEETFAPDFGGLCCRNLNDKTLAALVFEAEGRSAANRMLVAARKGRATWRITVRGRGAHAGGKHEHGANAITQLALTLQQLAALTNYARDLTFNAGTVLGGTVLNRVPHEAVAEGEFRAFSAETYEQAKTQVLALAGSGAIASPADGYACAVSVEITSETRPWPRNAATDRLIDLWQRTGRQLKLPVGLEERGGLSDGNLLWDVVPTLDGLGPWGDNDHCSERTPDGSKLPEFVEVSSFVPKALLNTMAISALADLF